MRVGSRLTGKRKPRPGLGVAAFSPKQPAARRRRWRRAHFGTTGLKAYNFRKRRCITIKIYWNGTSKNIIGENLRRLRTARGLTQRALAEALQLRGGEFSNLTILRIERGERFVPDYEVKALAEFFGVNYACLLDGEEERGPG